MNQSGSYFGRTYWAIGFVMFAPLGNLLAPIVASTMYWQVRSHPVALVRENARNAANWLLTWGILSTVFGGLGFFVMILSFLLDKSALFTVGISGYFLAVALMLVNLVVTIMGTVRANLFSRLFWKR